MVGHFVIIQKPDPKIVRKMTIWKPDSPVFGCSLQMVQKSENTWWLIASSGENHQKRFTRMLDMESMSRYASPVNSAIYPHLAFVLLSIGLFFTAWFLSTRSLLPNSHEKSSKSYWNQSGCSGECSGSDSHSDWVLVLILAWILARLGFPFSDSWRILEALVSHGHWWVWPWDNNLVTMDNEEVASLLAVEEDGFIKVASNKVKPKPQPNPLTPIAPHRPPSFPTVPHSTPNPPKGS
jgi:hypothetical protein